MILPKFYRYMIFRIYTWRLNKKDNTPVTTTELLMCIPHYFHLLTIYSITVYFFPKLDFDFSKFQILLIGLTLQLILHLLIYNKRKWANYVDEFKIESLEMRKKRGTTIYLYHIASFLLFLLILPILFG